MKIYANEAMYDTKKVDEFLTLVFKDTDDIRITPDNNILILDVENEAGRRLRKARVPVNIKDRNLLGWFSDEHNLCLLPLKNGKFILKTGCSKNKAIRPLTATFGW